MSEHDPEAWLQRRSRLDKADHRPNFNAGSPDAQFQRDRARIVHAASFRALQSKTQVLGLGENDFYRTRLTHSLEVAQIGSGIVEHLLTANRDARLTPWLPSSGLMEATCLAHDLGHPPFGHGGEVALNYAMLSAGGFEGNGQTLRILSRLGEFSERCGIDVTRACWCSG
ncbi:MAG: dGTP triphosphohydrolase, partial [Pseudomonadota bacterium]